MISRKKVIVVGGGISGLTTATSLAKRGVQVLLIERNDICGGLVNSFTRDGFLFDGGVRAIENAGMVKPMLDELDIDLTLFRSKISLGVENEVIHVETEESVHDYEELLKRIYPESIEDVEKVISLIKTHVALGGTQINMNVVDKKKILEAHDDPYKHPDLVVRVTGFSAYFGSLSPEFRQLVVDRILSEE